MLGKLEIYVLCNDFIEFLPENLQDKGMYLCNTCTINCYNYSYLCNICGIDFSDTHIIYIKVTVKG